MHMGKKSSVLVTGAGGILGNELTTQLCDSGYKVYALTSDKKKVKGRHSGNIVCYENNDLEIIPWDEIDSLVHCAFTRSSSGYELTKSLDYSKKIFNIASEKCLNSVINISSRSIYGQNLELPWYEYTAPDPDSSYAVAKYSSELLAENIKYLSRGKTQAVNIRLAGLIGTGYNQRIVSKFVDDVLKSKPIHIIGGKQIFSYLDVRDAASGIIALLRLESRLWNEVYNLGSKECFNIIEIAESVAEIAKLYTKKSVKIEIEEKDIYYNAKMDSSLFYNATNWEPKYKIRDTIEYLFKSNILELKNKEEGD